MPSLSLTPARWAGFLMLAAMYGCAKPPAARSDPDPAPVAVATASRMSMPVQVSAIGSVRVISTVSIRAAVAGELTAVHFHEGEFVTRGQKLFTIDPRPYEAALKRAEATLAQNQATLKGAELALARVERIGSGAISGAETDAARVAVAAATAAVEADRAAIQSARLQLEYTSSNDPIGGRTGALLVTPGNRLSTGDPNPLVVINQLSPIDVQFSVSERDLAAVAAAFESKKRLRAEAVPRHGGTPAVGELDFIDNAVEPGTGTVQLKAQFPNTDRRLWPGQFVDVVLTLGQRPDCVVVPVAALRSGQKGSYVFVVTPGRRAELRPVTVAFEVGGEAVVATGLSEGETVVTDGHLRLAPGIAVAVQTPPAATPHPSVAAR